MEEEEPSNNRRRRLRPISEATQIGKKIKVVSIKRFFSSSTANISGGDGNENIEARDDNEIQSIILLYMYVFLYKLEY